MSKRKLLRLVEEGYVNGWDDPRMPTIAGLRRRGFTPEAISMFVEKVGYAKRANVIDMGLLEWAAREDLNKKAQRVMGVIDPLKVVIMNYPEDLTEYMDAVNNPEDESAGTRKVPFSRIVYIERSDFMENPPKKFYRLAPGREVRLRYAYWIKCTDVVKDDDGNIVEIHATYDPETRGGNNPPDGRKVKATLHWVSAAHALQAEVRLYDRLFLKPDPDDVPEGQDFTANINPNSLVVKRAYVEPSLKDTKPGEHLQLERVGYFCVDPDSTEDHLILNRTVTLKDEWAKIAKQMKK